MPTSGPACSGTRAVPHDIIPPWCLSHSGPFDIIRVFLSFHIAGVLVSGRKQGQLPTTCSQKESRPLFGIHIKSHEGFQSPEAKAMGQPYLTHVDWEERSRGAGDTRTTLTKISLSSAECLCPGLLGPCLSFLENVV